MWAIKLMDGKPSSMIYLREGLLDGRILVFDKEEAALRLLRDIKDALEHGLRVRLTTVRFDGDPRQDRPYKVPDSAIDSLAQFMLAYLK